MSKCLVLALLVLTVAPFSLAQRGAGFGHPMGRGFGRGFANLADRGFGRNAVFFGDWFDDYPAGAMAYAGPTPPVILMDDRPSRPAEPERASTPLLIEWQGDRYVRVAGAPAASAADYSESPPNQLHSTLDRSTVAQADLPPAVLIFRDGHQEQVSDYVIARGVLYAQGNYALTGEATRDIQLSALNLSATLQANQKNGLKFVLPAGPNEVVTRP